MSLHFRTSQNGHYAVFRVVQGSNARPNFVRLGHGNVNKTGFTPEEQNAPTAEEQVRIDVFAEEQRALDREERLFDVRRLPMRMRQTMHWLATASQDDMELVGDALLYSLYDLREALMKRRLELAQTEIDQRIEAEEQAEDAAGLTLESAFERTGDGAPGAPVS